MKNMKTIRQLFLVGFWTTLLLPISIVVFSAIKIFLPVTFIDKFFGWIFFNGGIWILAVIEIIIFLITLMLFLTLRLSTREVIEDEKGIRIVRKSEDLDKIQTVEYREAPVEVKKLNRKEIKNLEKRVIEEEEVEEIVTKRVDLSEGSKKEDKPEVKRDEKKEVKVDNKENKPPRPMFSNLKR